MKISPFVLISLSLAPCAEPIDGTWVAVEIDGRKPAGEYRIVVRDGRIDGGRDGCNDWGRDPERPEMIVINLQGCPDDPLRDAYWTIAYYKAPPPALGQDGCLRAAARGHALLFRRAEEEARGNGSPRCRKPA